MVLFVSLLLLFSFFSFAVSTAVYCYRSPTSTGFYVYVLVNSTLYNSLYSALTTYQQDLENDGFSVEISQDFGNTAEAVREFLQTEAETHEIAGALLVGAVPYAKYAMGEEHFPCDLFFMDLDGNWTDSNSDGVYDLHTNETGDLEPEIWVGRLWASTLTFGGESELLINYFDKNHRFRTGNLTLPRRALAYIDDEFVGMTDDVNSSLRGIYGDQTTIVIDPETTNVTDYGNRLNDTIGYEWLLLMSHGNHKKHAFNTSGGWAYFYSSEVLSIDPHAFFYNLMACNTADYAQTNYIGASYIFADTYGLLVIGSTKAHFMWNVSDLYEPISNGRNIGEAFKNWFEKNGELNQYTSYGLTILGDPALRTPRICDVAVVDVAPFKHVVVQNSTMPVNVTVENKGSFAETFNVTVYANTTFIGNLTVTQLASLTTTICTFNWNTTGFVKGNYTINATAVLPIDNNPTDNTYIDGWVVVLFKNDVAVVDVAPFKHVVVQNSTMPVNVTVENKGSFAETFNVTVYANTTFIGNLTVTQLASLTTTICTFNWNTTGFVKGNYTINATATPVPGETDLTDNMRRCWIVVTFVGDVDGDGKVFASDMVLELIHFGQSSAQFPEGDLDGDGIIFASDMVIVLINFGAGC